MDDTYRKLERAYLQDKTKENAEAFWAARVRIGDPVTTMTQDFDWRQVFEYANGTKGDAAGPNSKREAIPWDDIRRPIYSSEGANDRDDWVVVFELFDSRILIVSAGCDYTGWG